MDDSEFVLKKLCCTCLSRDRNLSQLCRLKEGINNLYLLLSYDSEAYREGFYKDTANWYICWECWAVMMKICKFRSQVCLAQKQLSNIVEGRADFKHLNACLSHLTSTRKSFIDLKIVGTDPVDNFIDCTNIKTESDDDIPLAALHNTFTDDHYSDNDSVKDSSPKDAKKENQIKTTIELSPKKTPTDSGTRMKKIKSYKFLDDNNKYFKTIIMTEEEMLESRSKRKLKADYADAIFKCESCIEGFRSKNELDIHVAKLHAIDMDKKKSKRLQCNLCLAYVKKSLSKHKSDHYLRFVCQFCDNISYSLNDILKHMKMGHLMQNLDVPIEKKKGQRKSVAAMKPGSKMRKKHNTTAESTHYLCTECNKYFDNKNKRWKHVQQHHKEGYKCSTCGKRFAFRNSLNRHEQLHQAPPPREECKVCHKMVRVDLVKIHAKIHTQRDRFRCAECDKCFVSRASYEHHLKYTQAHSASDILKYKCSLCDKGYRSRGELRDHINYKHMDKTQHKCPICDKALATRRCITRHVKRAHKGLKEYPKNKICQQCGKAFRDKKGLREHEFIHTGERPLACELCGCTFRQSASLYTHKKRVHKIIPVKKHVTLVESVVS